MNVTVEIVQEDDGRRGEALRHLCEMPGTGHTRTHLTVRPVKFWSVYSYLIVHDPANEPFAVIAVLHGARDVEDVLTE